VLLLWAIELVDGLFLAGSLDRLGIRPRTVDGLIGIPLHPFLHLGFAHLALNTVGILLFGGLVILRDPRDFWTALLLGTFVGGAGVWLFGRPSIHIGASGVVFALFGYLLLTGWFDRSFGAILLSTVVFLLWGTALFGLSPTQVGVSWEAHLFGFVAGGMTAWMRARRRMTPPGRGKRSAGI
jgi:membrane associated rhomboid family serine protease